MLERQLIEMERTLQSLADDQVGFLADAQLAKVAQRRQLLDQFAAIAHRRRAMSLRKNAFGCWGGIAKSNVESAMVPAMELLQAQVAAFEEALLESRSQIEAYEQTRALLRVECCSELEAEVTALKVELKALQAQVDTSEEQRKVLETELARFEAERASLQSKLTSGLQQCGELQANLFEVQEIASARQRQVRTFDKALIRIKRTSCSSTLTFEGLSQLVQLQQTIKQLEKDKDRLKLEKEAKATELALSRIEWERDNATQLVLYLIALSKMKAVPFACDCQYMRNAADIFVVLAVGSECEGKIFGAGVGRGEATTR